MRLLICCFLWLFAMSTASAADLPDAYVTLERDTLYAIADRTEIYGDAALWVALWDANKDKLQSPHVLPAGITLEIPRDMSMLEILNYRQRAENYNRGDKNDGF